MASEKPGMMMYWEVFDTLNKVRPEKIKTLLAAMRNFAQYGEVPDFNEDEALELVWPLIEQKILADSFRYEDIKQKRAEAGRKGGKARNAKQMQANEANASNAKQTKPTSTSTPTSTPSTTATTAATTAGTSTTSASAPPPPKATKHKHGEYSNVLLTDEELDKLQGEFPHDWQQRIDNLSGYIASTGKAYKSHYATLRSWARRDKEEAQNRPRNGYYIDNPCSHITPEDHEKDSENPF